MTTGAAPCLRAGAIPSSLATNVNLETLDVKGNRLSILPSEWIAGYDSVVNSSLVNVRISFNNFSGPFPRALQHAPQLTFLVINNNTLRRVAPGGTPSPLVIRLMSNCAEEAITGLYYASKKLLLRHFPWSHLP